MVIVWTALISVALSMLVLVIGISGFAAIETANEPKAAPQACVPPSIEVGVVAPMLVGVVIGSLLSLAVPCSFSQLIATHRMTFFAGVAALTVAGGVVFWRRRMEGRVSWSAGSALAAVSMVILFVPVAGAERCEQGKVTQNFPSVQKDVRLSAGRQVGRDIARWWGSGIVLGYTTVDTVTRGVGLPVLQPPRQDLPTIAQAAKTEINASGLFVTAAWPFLLGIFIFGCAQWMTRAPWRRMLGAGIIGVTSALVFPVCFGLLSLAASLLAPPEAALGFWLGGAVLGLIASLVITVWAARTGTSHKALPSD